jgi:hypothetical protein
MYITLRGAGETKRFMKGLDVSNITLSDFILDCSTKFSRDSQLSSSADRLEIYYKPTDGQWRQLFGDDDLRRLLQTMKMDVLDLKLEVSKRGRFSTYKSIDDVLDKCSILLADWVAYRAFVLK